MDIAADAQNRSTPHHIVAALRELVAALDRRLENLTRGDADRLDYDPDLVAAIMTDDGGPSFAPGVNPR